MTNTEIIVNLATIIAKQSLEISELKTEVQHLHHELLATMSEASEDEPQTDCEACELDGKADVCKVCRVSNYERQTDCPWK
jgi:hypothetical protein